MTDTADSDAASEPADSEDSTVEWTEEPARKGRLFVADDGRRLELAPQTDGEWAADLLHERGCTRITFADTEAELIERLLERSSLDIAHLL